MRTKTTITKTISDRGFGFFHFQDRDGLSCRLQDSSLAEEPAIRFGPVENMMHLTQMMVRQLLPCLTKFAETGDYLTYIDIPELEEDSEEDEDEEDSE